MTRNPLNLTILSLLSLSYAVSAFSQSDCYNAPGNLTPTGTSQSQSPRACKHLCHRNDQDIFALHGDECYCGNSLPPSGNKVSNKECMTECSGFSLEYCGGPNTWLVVSHVRDQWEQELDSDSTPDPDPLATLTVNPAVVQTGLPIATAGGGSDDYDDHSRPTVTIPVKILTAPSASFPKNLHIASSNSPSMSTALSSASSPSSSSRAASPSTSSAAAATLGRSGSVIVAGSTVGAVLFPLVVSWFY